MDGICSICDKETKVIYLPIYAFGSEGIWVCEKCSQMIVSVISNLAYVIKSRIAWAKYKENAKGV